MVYLWLQVEQDSKCQSGEKPVFKLIQTSGFKFLPVLGKYIADCFENKAPEELRQKWRLNLPHGGSSEYAMKGDGSRAGPPLRKLTPSEKARL